MPKTGIVICAYRRPDLLSRLLTSLEACPGVEDMPISIFVDGARGRADRDGVAATAEVARSTSLGKRVDVFCRETNFGLAKSVISAVTQGFENNDNLIVLEDDLVLAPETISYFKNAIECLPSRPEVMTITAYQYPKHSIQFPDNLGDRVKLLRRAHSWSWAIRKSDWETLVWGREQMLAWMAEDRFVERLREAGPDLPGMMIDWLEGRNDSWAVRMAANQAYQDRFSFYPEVSLIKNTGFGAAGTHTVSVSNGTRYNTEGQLKIEAGITQMDIQKAKFSKANQAALNQFFIPDGQQELTPPAVSSVLRRFRNLGSRMKRNFF